MPIFNLTNGADIFPSGVVNSGDDTIYGGDDSDAINGGLGADNLYGGLGNDTLHGNEDNDFVYGDEGADNIFGDAGDDTVDGGDGNDTVQGNAGADSVLGGAGDDKLYGQADNDQLFGGDGNDLMDGGAGADAFDGNDGFDTVTYRAAAGGIRVDVDGNTDTGVAIGDTFANVERYWLGTGNDTFIGGAAGAEAWGIEGNDTLIGGAGADKLNGGIGDDTMTGGGESDTFVISAGLSGNDTITDWVDATDYIQIYGASATQFSDLVITDNAGSALITLPDGSTITLSGVDFNTVDNSDFIWGP